METNNRLFRMQSNNDELNSFTNSNMPIRRVVISDDGEITFNPDEHKYIYFSRSPKHHYYYIYKKILKIINDELKRAHAENNFEYNIPANLKRYLPARFTSLKHYTTFNTNVIRNVQTFFRDYLPPKYVELVSLTYLNAFTEFINKCVVHNMKKIDNPGPEISDTAIYGGAYGINDAWLDLLKCSITHSENCTISIDQFFDFLIDNCYYSENTRHDIEKLSEDKQFFDMLNYFTYKKLLNPQFYDRNNINDAIRYIEKIEREQLFAHKRELTPYYFRQVKSNFKNEIHEMRD
ncbi:MAG: hypothetical protein E7345_02385 [Clostridiales bacterium]|nr:hypothetical protein [Clostridiales bacterium]